MPHLTSSKPNPSEEVTHYVIVGLPGNPEAPYAPELNEYGLFYDVTDLPDGTYDIMVSACNIWGCSLTAPFSLTKSLPLIPMGLMIVFG